jgi:hypothetical protein
MVYRRGFDPLVRIAKRGVVAGYLFGSRIVHARAAFPPRPST